MQDNKKHFDKIKYYGKEYDIDYTGEQHIIDDIENAQFKEFMYQTKKSKFISGVQPVNYDPQSEQKYTKKRTYHKEITALKEALKAKGKLTEDAELSLDRANYSLLSITEDFKDLEDPELAGYDAQRKILSNIAVAEKNYMESNANDNTFDKDYFRFGIRNNVPYSLIYEPKYIDIIKTAGQENDKNKAYSRIRFSKDDKFFKNLLEVLNDLDNMNMIDDENISFEEGFKKYAGRQLFDTRAKIASYFVPDKKIANDEEKLKEFYEQKADEFDVENFDMDFNEYQEAAEKYTEVKSKCDKYFSKTDHCTNIDVLRNVDADALITENTHSSSVLSSAFTILKFWKQIDKERHSLEDFLENPSIAFMGMINKVAQRFSNANLKNKNRGEILAKLDEMIGADVYEAAGLADITQRLEECFITIAPDKKFAVGMTLNLQLPQNQLEECTKRGLRLDVDKNFDTVFAQLVVTKDEDFEPERITYTEYYDFQQQKYYQPVTDNVDKYIRDNKIDFEDIYNKTIEIVDQYEKAEKTNTEKDFTGVVSTAQHFAEQMYTKHFNEMSKSMQKKFRDLASDPIKAMKYSIDKWDIIKREMASFKEKAKQIDAVNSELPVYEKYVVKKENEFNKEYAKLNQKIADANKKNNPEEANRLKALQDEMKAKRLTTIVRDYNSGKLPESYALTRIQDILNGDLKEVKGIFKASGYKTAQEYCEAHDLEDLSQEEMDQVYQSALDEKSIYLQERTGVMEPAEKIDILAELTRHGETEVTRKVVEGLKENLEAQENSKVSTKSLEVYKNKEIAKDNNLAK